MKAGAVYKYDLSLPLEKMYDLVEEMRVQIGNNEIHYFFFVLLNSKNAVLFHGDTLKVEQSSGWDSSNGCIASVVISHNLSWKPCFIST